jgi:ribonucleoside-diphosphate reductase beta chain
MSLLLGPSTPAFKPFKYPWAYDLWLIQKKIEWLPEEAPMAEDVKDWHTKMTKDEKHLITSIFRFFVQADMLVNDAYTRHYMKHFKHPEILMMMTAFSGIETVHIAAYSHLIDSLGMPDIEYSRFLQYEEMKNKYDYFKAQSADTTHELLRTIAIFAAFTEGLQLFSSFAILLNFPRFNKMKSMGQIITWSARDENLHCTGMLRLFATLIHENPHLWTKQLQEEIIDAMLITIGHEDAFIDLAFKGIDIEGITAHECKQYIRYVANRRLITLGLSPYYSIASNPFPWMDEQLNNVEMVNFFEQRGTEYSRAAMTGEWNEAAFSFSGW